MSNSTKHESLAQLKEKARQFLSQMADELARRRGVNLEDIKTRKRSDSEFLKNVVLVTDPIKISFEDSLGGSFTCTYDISQTLVGLLKRIQEDAEDFTDSEVEEFAKMENISIDQAMSKIALRYVEAEIFAKLKAGRFLHRQLKPALEHMLGELVDDAFIQCFREYGYELDVPGKVFEKMGREHAKHLKKRSGLVRPPGHPPTWTKEELTAKVKDILSKQKKTPTLARIAREMNYGGLRGGASALGKLLKRHSIEWKDMRKEWQETRKRT